MAVGALAYFFLGLFLGAGFGLAPFFLVKTRAKILSTFFSWRGRSKAYSICLRGTLLVISLSAKIWSWKFSPSFHERMACDWTNR